MDSASSGMQETAVHLTVFDAIADLFQVSPVFLLGVLAVCVMLAVMFRGNRATFRVRKAVVLILLYYYLCIMLANVVGTPCLSELARLLGLGEPLFSPSINLVPFDEGLKIGFVLNIMLFIPLGFLCPLVSKSYQSVKTMLLTGFGLSFAIEISQLFTLYRITDVNDLIANVAGTLIGYLCFVLARRLHAAKAHPAQNTAELHYMQYMPIATIAIAFVLAFFR